MADIVSWAESYQRRTRERWLDEPLLYSFVDGEDPLEMCGVVTSVNRSTGENGTGVQVFADQMSVIISRSSLMFGEVFRAPQVGHMITRADHGKRLQVVQRDGRCWRPHGTVNEEIRIHVEETPCVS